MIYRQACEHLVAGESAMLDLGRTLARQWSAPAVVTLDGPLGAGKTTLVRGYLRGLGVTTPVRSPTYTLVESYQTSAGPVHHFDLYRLGHPEELEDLGWRDYFERDASVLIEWPERAGGMLPRPDWRVIISPEQAGSCRRLRLEQLQEEAL